MRAIVCRALSADIATLKLEDVTLPPPAPGQARVRMRAAAVNFPDILTVQGKYQHKPALPFTPGVEGAGDLRDSLLGNRPPLVWHFAPE